jgi:hypothetical protein
MGLQPKSEEEDRESILPVLRPEGDLSLLAKRNPRLKRFLPRER